METKVTSKFQTTIPKKVRKVLNIQTGKEVQWNIIKEMVVVDVAGKMAKPVEFLTSQIKINRDAVRLVRETREEIA
mgnify:CR=1 FL=1